LKGKKARCKYIGKKVDAHVKRGRSGGDHRGEKAKAISRKKGQGHGKLKNDSTYTKIKAPCNEKKGSSG